MAKIVPRQQNSYFAQKFSVITKKTRGKLTILPLVTKFAYRRLVISLAFYANKGRIALSFHRQEKDTDQQLHKQKQKRTEGNRRSRERKKKIKRKGGKARVLKALCSSDRPGQNTGVRDLAPINPTIFLIRPSINF